MAIQEEGLQRATGRPWLPAALAAGSGFVVVGLLVLLWFGLQQKEIAGTKVVNVWASWCGPCADEAPALEAAFRRNGDRFTFIGVNVQDTDADAQAFLRKYGVSYLNGSGNAGPISIQYGMRGVPETYFIAPDGRLVRKWNALTAADLDQFLTELQRASARAG